MNNIKTLKSNEIQQVNGGHEVWECTEIVDGDSFTLHCKLVEHEHPEPQLF